MGPSAKLDCRCGSLHLVLFNSLDQNLPMGISVATVSFKPVIDIPCRRVCAHSDIGLKTIRLRSEGLPLRDGSAGKILHLWRLLNRRNPPLPVVVTIWASKLRWDQIAELVFVKRRRFRSLTSRFQITLKDPGLYWHRGEL